MVAASEDPPTRDFARGPTALSSDQSTANEVSDPAVGESQLTSLLNILSGTFYRCEARAPWRMSYVSQGVAELTGLPVEAFENLAWQDLMHPDDASSVQAEIDEAIINGQPFSVAYRIFHDSGELRWVRERGRAVREAGGDIQYLEGMISDVTQEQNLREESEQSQLSVKAYAKQLSEVLESTSDCVFSLDRAWRFTYLNGRTLGEFPRVASSLGHNILSVLPSLEDSPFWEPFQRTMDTRQAAHCEAFMEGLGHWYEAHISPSEDGITVFFRNIDDRRLAEEAVREREARHKTTLDQIPQMVWCTRADGYHDYYSRLWYDFTGMPEGSTDGEGWNDIFHPDDQERAWAKWRNSLQTGEHYEIEYRLRHRTGEYRWVLGRAWPERDAKGEIVRWHGTCTDIHDKILAQNALVESQRLQESVLEASADCIKIIRRDGTVEFINGSGLLATELGTLASLMGKPWVSLWPEAERATVQKALDCALSDKARFSGFSPTGSGIPKWWDVVVTPIKDDQGQIARLLVVSRDITAQREAADQLKWASEHDDLTRLPNRKAFEAHLDATTSRARSADSAVALLLIDLDHFKHVNDTLGHVAGDHLLGIYAQRIRSVIGPNDFVARLGGDEFAVVLEPIDGKFSPLATGHAIVESLSGPVEFDGRFISAGASLGGAIFPRDADTASDLFKIADIALYALKEGGRGGIRMFHSHMREEAQLAASQLSLARVAVTAQAVEPHYQPKVELATGRIVGMEALLRWRHETRGLQTPDTVFEAFKDYRLAAKIGDLMQRRVFQDLRNWLDQGLSVGTISINAAPAEFLRDDFAGRLFSRMAEHSIPPNLIEIEVTEHVFLNRGSDIVGRALELLNQGGVRIALDDFGTGHSSLSHLRDFPVDVVKIDKSFVDRLAQDRGARAIVSAVMGLASNLGIDVVAEGIENELQRRLLIEDGGRLGQGYLFGRPIAADAVPAHVGLSNPRLVA
jgi:diguanylate cyclase (GGDEF)-like protein/PAS domain S-box-containing protein